MFAAVEDDTKMSGAAKPQGAAAKSGRSVPGFAQLQRLGKSLMLPIAVLPAAGILLRLGQDDLLGKIHAPVIGSFFKAMTAAGAARHHCGMDRFVRGRARLGPAGKECGHPASHIRVPGRWKRNKGSAHGAGAGRPAG